jgi:hypothetical protein
VRLAAKAHAAVPPSARLNVDAGAVVKHRGRVAARERRPSMPPEVSPRRPAPRSPRARGARG